MVWGAFATAEWAQGEAGITAAVVMGLATQRGAVPEERRLRLFKEQLTVLGISLLFVLLAANLPLDVVIREGWRGILTVVALTVLVRPVSVWVSLRKSTMTWKEKLFVMFISPRGIVAASVASLFALELTEAGFEEGQRVLAITFLTIAITVTMQGLTAGWVSRLLGLDSLAGSRAIVVGAGPLALAVAGILARFGRPVTVVDRNTALVEQAREQGFDAREGNALDEDVLDDAGAEEAETVVAVTTNSEVNALAAHLAANGIQTAINYPMALPFLSAYSRLMHRPEQFPNAFGDQSRILSLPMFAEISRDQQLEVIDLIRAF